MTPRLIDAPYTQRLMMDRGLFVLMHVWDIEDGDKLEYWRGLESNGAVIRFVCPDYSTFTHYQTPGAALQCLVTGGYPVPGVAPCECPRCGLMSGHRYPCAA
jgi:hypothetical protein